VRTALRELEEECGIRLSTGDLEQALPHMTARRRVGNYLLVAPFVFRVDCELPTVLDAREAAGSLWIPLRTLLDPSHHLLRPVPGRPAELLFPAIDLEGMPLWGFTYRLLTQWLRLTPQGDPLQAGMAAAGEVLEFVLSLGCKLRHSWTPREHLQVAAVDGPIPTDAVIAHFASKWSHIAAVNCMDAQPDRIRVLGPAWEEYVIEADV
jgi:hypothetical protein